MAPAKCCSCATQWPRRRVENQRLVARNQQLAAEVRNLKQGFEALEERARSELGLIRGNETYYQVVPPDIPKAPAEGDATPAALSAAAR